jgi:hypothetical protein
MGGKTPVEPGNERLDYKLKKSSVKIYRRMVKVNRIFTKRNG